MVKRCFSVWLVLLLLSASVMHITAAGGESVGSYASEWKKVDEFYNKGLPQSALKEVEKLYARAKREKNAAETVKALINRVRFIQEVEEDSFVKIQTILMKELETAQVPLRPLLHSMMAELYWNFYQQNRWTFLNRSATVDFKNDDMRTWDLRKIVDQVTMHYDESLKNAQDTQKVTISLFDPILANSNAAKASRVFRPTLFDFLAHRAIDFYANQEAGLTRPVYAFSMTGSEYFSDIDTFIAMKITTKDTDSFKYRALLVFQELLRFHRDDKESGALIDANLKRLNFINAHAVVANKDFVYEDALTKMTTRYADNPEIAEAWYLLAQLYMTRGNAYVAHQSDDNRWDKKKARELCEQTIKKYPGSLGANNCEYLLVQLDARWLQVQLERVTYPGDAFRVLLSYKNIKKVYFKAVKAERDQYLWKSFNNNEDMISYYHGKKPAAEWSVDVSDEKDYQQHATEVAAPSLPFGDYIILASDSKDFDYKKRAVGYGYFTVSTIAFIQRNSTNKGLEFRIVDRKNGQSLSSVEVQTWYQVYNNKTYRYDIKKGTRFTSDQNGNVLIPANTRQGDYNYFYCEFIKDKDKLYTDYTLSAYSYGNDQQYDRYRTFFFTDRSMYRPGQIAYFKGIVIKTDAQGVNTIAEGFTSTVTLYDANGQKVSSVDVRANEYGTFDGTFALPTGVLTGNMTINNGHGAVSFSVEEYKRPKFEVTFKPAEKSFKLNDKVTVTGTAMAYAGYAIDNADVKYRVVRSVYFPYRWYRWWYTPSYPDMEIANGTLTTDGAGAFNVTFDALPDLSVNKTMLPAFIYTVYADVTDINGETHSNEKAVRIGYTSLMLNANCKETIDKSESKYEFGINSTNLDGDFLPAKGTVTLYKLKDATRPQRKRLWQTPDVFLMSEKEYTTLFPVDVYNKEDDYRAWERGKSVFSASFDTQKEKKVEFKGISGWETGYYCLEMTAKDSFGNDIKEVKYISVYSARESKMPFATLGWFTVVKGTCEPGENAEILIGSAEKNVRVLYEIEHQGKLVSAEYVSLNNEQKLLRIPIKEEHRGNLGVSLTFIQHGRFYRYQPTIFVPWSNKRLDISFETFRNKLLPGEKEEWRLKITGPKKEKIAAEMVAALYDASLDAFRVHGWAFDIYPYYYSRHYWSDNQYFGSMSTSTVGILQDRYVSYQSRSYDALFWFNFYWDGYRNRYRNYSKSMERPSMPMMSGAPAPEEAEEMNMVAADESPKSKKEASKDADDGIADTPEKKKEDTSKVKARTNFNETAFFYPKLYTNEKGEVIVSFTIPESLTKWKMLGFAHTKDLKYGMIQNELVTQKELMIVPNAPRFFREGDTIDFTAKVTNLTDKEMSGTAEFILLDASTMKPIHEQFGLKTTFKNFSAKKGQSDLVTWTIKIPSGVTAVTYRVVAKAGKFSDGEEMTLPILTNRMLVTESMPLPVRSLQTKDFTFKKLVENKSTTLRHHKLTLEFTSNPAWYAVQALPYLIEYPYECTEQTFSRFYANSIASYIANSSPRIKKVFDSWKNQGGKDALLSNLEKNQELKALLLEETPWVMDAQSETERKHRIGVLFDLNRMADELGRAFTKIEEAQISSGGWPWFRGGYESRYITQHIVAGFAHLDALKVIDMRKDTRVWAMLMRAIPYLDARMQEDYNYLIKNKVNLKQNNLGYETIHYLYMRSFFTDVPLASSFKKAYEYYRGQSQTYWLKNNIYSQAMIALMLNRTKDSKTANAIIASIKEYALHSEEMGMYWKFDRGYYWYQAPIETQAMLIEAFAEITNDPQAVDDMKTWLIKQKQTQDWGTTKATVEACYALLLRGADWLAETKLPTIVMGGKELDITSRDDVQVQEGTGYFKTSWSGSEVISDMGKVTVTNNNNVVAWGALYWQYFEQLDKITPHETPLKLTKKLFVERQSDKGPVIEPITEQTVLKPGDRVKVRIELRVDRAMEYVHMKDMRASGFEPENVFSQYKWQDGLGYYEATKDAATNFFIDWLPKGTYVFEYPLRVTHTGNFSNGITTIQCMYAPEFTSHSEGIRVNITGK